jgi:P27 family predicted phage terminase small subunit
MGARGGVAPKPRALRLLHGDRKDRINNNEPVPSDEPMEPPKGIAADVRAVWDFTVRHLQIMGTAAASDRDALRAYCEAVVGHAKASAILANSPVLVKGIHGGMVRNPALQIQRDCAHTMLRFGQEFGLTPSARTRIEVGGDGREDDNPFAGQG